MHKYRKIYRNIILINHTLPSFKDAGFRPSGHQAAQEREANQIANAHKTLTWRIPAIRNGISGNSKRELVTRSAINKMCDIHDIVQKKAQQPFDGIAKDRGMSVSSGTPGEMFRP